MTCDKSLEPATISHFDSGPVNHGLVLAAWSRGFRTVINGQGIMQPAVVREHANISDDMVIMTCIAKGYPNHDFAANGAKSRCTPNENIVTYTGFEQTGGEQWRERTRYFIYARRRKSSDLPRRCAPATRSMCPAPAPSGSTTRSSLQATCAAR